MSLKPKKIKAIKFDFEAAKIPVTEIAKKYGVGRTTIIRLSKERNWKKRKKMKARKPPEKRKRGGENKYKLEYVKQATALCMLGFTNEKLASFFNVVEDTIYEWKKVHPEFSDALRAGRENASMKVAASLFRRTIGYSYEEEKISYENGQEISRVITKRHAPPEVKAITLWLKNKYPELWKERQEITASVEQKIGKITKEDAEFVKQIFDDITE